MWPGRCWGGQRGAHRRKWGKSCKGLQGQSILTAKCIRHRLVIRLDGQGSIRKAVDHRSWEGYPPPALKQDKSSRGSVDTTKTRSGPQRVRMCSGEKPIGAAKGKQSDTEALCQTPPSRPKGPSWEKTKCTVGKIWSGHFLVHTLLGPIPSRWKVCGITTSWGVDKQVE